MTSLLILKRSLRATSQRVIFSACKQSLVTAIPLGAPPPLSTHPFPAGTTCWIRQRHVSSTTSHAEKLTLLTRQIIETSGTLSEKAWTGAEYAFDLWTSHPVSPQGAEWAWNLLDRLVASEASHGKKQRLTSGWLYRMVGIYVENEGLAVDPTMVQDKLQTYKPVLCVDAKTQALLDSIEYRTITVNGQEQAMNLSLESVFEEEPVAVASESNVLSFPETGQGSQHVGVSSQPPDTTVQKKSTIMMEDKQPPQSTPIEPVVLELDAIHSKPVGSMNANDWKSAEHALSHPQSCENAFFMLDRLIQEDPQRVNTEWLNRLVQQWMEHGTMPASELLVKLSDYAPLPDVSTYDIIVSAIRSTHIVFPKVGAMSLADWERAHAELTTLTSLDESPVTPTRLSSAWNILDRLVEEDKYGKEHVDSYKSRLHPDWLNRIVEAWCSCPFAEDATDILVRINRYAPDMTPDPYIYQMIVNTVSKKETQGTKREMEMTREESRSHVTSKKPETTNRPHDNRKVATPAPIVSTEWSESSHNADSGHGPTTRTYTRKLQGMLKKNATNWRDAEGLLNEMWERYNAGNLSVKPNTTTYNTVLKLIAKSSGRDSGERAEALLRRMQELNDAGDTTVKPDLTSFTTCIAAWTKNDGTVAAERAQSLFDLLKEMYEAGDASLKPDTFAYKSLLKALSRAADERFGDVAESILSKMHALHDNGDVDVKPDTTSYNMVMQAIARSRRVIRAKRAKKAESMLELMEKEFASGKVSLKPNLQSYYIVINAWCRCQNVPESGDRAEILLNRLETVLKVKPGRKIYNAVINAHARSGAAEKAEKVLEQLELNESYTSPNVMSYNLVIAAYASTGGEKAPLRAEAILSRMLESHDAGNSSVKPDPLTYSKIALAWLNSGSDNAINNAIKYLEELKVLRHPEAKQEFGITYDKIMKSLSTYEKESPELHRLRERIEGLRTDEARSASLSREGGEEVLNEEPKARLEENHIPQDEAVHTTTSTSNDSALTTSLA